MRGSTPFSNRSEAPRIRLLAAGFAVSLAAAGLLFAFPQEEQEDWPRRISVPEGEILLYQPQPDSLDGDRLRARAAVAVTPAGWDEAAFGTVWLGSRLVTDRDERVAKVLDTKVLRVGFPNASEEHKATLARILEEEIPKWDIEIALDRLLTSLELAETRRLAAADLNNDPPKILIRYEPAVLVTIDGEPRLQEIEGSDGLMRIINTPFNIVFDRNARRYFLYAGEEQWYAAPDWTGPWELTSGVPGSIAALAPVEQEQEAQAIRDSIAAQVAEAAAEAGETVEEEETGPPPSLVVATEPAELIYIEGPPEYTPISEADLLYVSNSESEIVMDLGSARIYVLLSGRWYSAESLDGPWVFVPGEQLPEGFARIPFESDKGYLLASVPGTEQAAEAVLDNQIPQTAVISRSEAKLEVEYDGEPKFEPIEETDGLELAVNSPNQVIKVENKYYAIDEAVWFVADSPTGPWAVADEVPPEIYTIPPSSSAYNTTYVYVYDSTPEVVYVGYYPGYTYSYVYGGTVVYGTGWYYPAWYGRYYYPRAATWGFHVRWNPWTGWSFGFSYGWGPFRFTLGFGGWWRGGWWGPARYRGYWRGYHRGWHRGAYAGFRAGYRAGSRAALRNNIYNRPRNLPRNVPSARPTPARQPAAAANRANNVFSDRDGNVYRRDGDGNWERNTREGWSRNEGLNNEARQERTRDVTRDRQPAQQPRAQQPRAQQPATSQRSTGAQLERSYNTRQRGTTRTNNYNASRSRSGAGRGGGRRR
ncbi:MAG: carbohydrate-binding family V/XII [Gemmatimonadota bacterium]|nr:MAG: carbohydrate-binding family V/XII [Gemmatimonadota bacterium]